MPRPPLPLETYGTIRKTMVKGKPTAITYYRDSDGVTRAMQRTGPTKAAAARKLVEDLKERLQPSSEDLTADSTVAELAEAWMKETEARDLAQGTIFKYRENVDRYIVKGLGQVRLREATVPRIDRFLKALVRNGQASGARLCRIILSGMFGMAARHGAVKNNPIREVGKITSTKSPVVALSPESARGLWAHLVDWDAGHDKRGAKRITDLSPVASLLAATAMRTGEALALKYDRLDLTGTRPSVLVNATIAAGSDGRLRWQPVTKSNTSHRRLYLPPFAVIMLQHREESAHSEFIFPSSTGTFRSPNNFRTQWRAALSDTEWAGVTPKAFRKAIATYLDREVGGDAAKDQLGHASQAITDAHYIERSHDGPDVAAALEKFFIENHE